MNWIALRIKEIKGYPIDPVDDDLLTLILSQIAILKSIDYTEKQLLAIRTAMQKSFNHYYRWYPETTLIDGLLETYAKYYKLI